MTPHTDEQAGPSRLIDTEGDEPLNGVYVAVVVVEAVTLVALWVFSGYFSG